MDIITLNNSHVIRPSDIPADAQAFFWNKVKHEEGFTVTVTFKLTERAAKMGYTKLSKSRATSFGYAIIDNNDRTFGHIL